MLIFSLVSRVRTAALCTLVGMFGLLSTVAIAAPPASESLPAPTGRYAVGRVALYRSDVDRPDPETNGARKLVVWAWYPAPRTSLRQTPAPWLPDAWAGPYWMRFAATYSDAPSSGLSIVKAMRAHARANAPVAHGRFPVLIFVPGKGETPLVYASLLEELASRGYVVLGITPTHESGYTVLEDGRVITDRQEPRMILNPNMSPADMRAKMAAIDAATAQSVRTCANDIRFVLRQLPDLARAGQLRGHLDIAHVGLLGHSQGGAASLEAGQDQQVDAVLDIDGALPRAAGELILKKPVMVINSDMIPRAAMAHNPNMQYEQLLKAANP